MKDVPEAQRKKRMKSKGSELVSIVKAISWRCSYDGGNWIAKQVLIHWKSVKDWAEMKYKKIDKMN